jgi:hypothetical protein
MNKSEMQSWALKGAEQRLVELADEARAIFATFPELRKQGRGFDANRGRAVTATVVKSRKRSRRRMSAAARKRISLAQKRRWAVWKAKQAKPEEGGATRRKGTERARGKESAKKRR